MFGNYYYSPFDYLGNATIASVFCLFLAIIAAIVLFIVFLPAKNESKYHGFLLWAHKALNFRTMFSLTLLKFLYLLSVCFISLYGLYMLFTAFFAGLGILVVGNLVTRVMYELIILIFSIHDNLSQINTNTSFLKGRANNAEPAGAAPAVQAAQPVAPQQQSSTQPPEDQSGNSDNAQQPE